MTRKTFILLSAVLSGCASLQVPIEEPVTTPHPLIVPATGSDKASPPTSINEAQVGSDTGYVDNGGFFYTIGSGVASIGDPRVAGLWVKAGFLDDGSQVEVHAPSTGLSVLVEGSKSEGILQMSLAAFQALQLNPASLSSVEIRTP